jgi:hypothetical protein
MSELDDAIREHLELKRRHGARDAELKELEDEAFGTGERPLDPFKAAAEAQVKGADEDEGPPAAPEQAVSGAPPELSDAEAEAETSIAEPTLGALPSDEPPAEPVAEAPVSDEPAAEEPAAPPPPSPDMPIPPPPPQPDRASEVVHQPTEEHPPPEPPSEEIADSAPPVEPPLADEPAAEDSPLEEAPAGDAGSMLYDFEADAPPSAPPETPAEPQLPEEPRPPLEPPPAGFEDDFEERPPLPDPDSADAFSDLGPAESREQEGELPIEDDELPPEEALSHDADFEAEEGPGAVTADTSEREALDPTEQYTLPAEEPAPQVDDDAEEEPPAATGEDPEDDAEEESVLEEEPDFLEETPEGEDDLWFEKKPPKDFDFEDD